MNSYAKICSVVATLAALGGCVVGQSLPTSYEPERQAVASNGIPVAVAVHDERPYVTNGDKPAYYVGKYRGGFGNPFDVTTTGKEPLADALSRDLGKELAALGYSVVEAPLAERTLDVTIRDWNFDAMIDGRFWYEFDTRVLAANGTQLAGSVVKDSQTLEGSIWTGAKSAFEAKMPEFYAAAIRKTVRDNDRITTALAGQR